jgi:hypothetical protein
MEVSNDLVFIASYTNLRSRNGSVDIESRLQARWPRPTFRDTNLRSGKRLYCLLQLSDRLRHPDSHLLEAGSPRVAPPGRKDDPSSALNAKVIELRDNFISCNVQLNKGQEVNIQLHLCIQVTNTSMQSIIPMLFNDDLSASEITWRWNINLDSHLLTWGSRESVGVATGYELDDQEVEVPVPVGSWIFSFSRRPDRVWGPPNLVSNGYRGFFPRG